MHHTLFDITTPWFDMPVRSYGVMLMIGFLIGVWWTCKRAARVKVSPDIIIDIAMVGLVTGILGGRLFYVIHYYERDFAGESLWQMINITQGGMEFYGSFIGCFVGATAYLLIKRASFRLYMDIMAPAFMFGIAMGRIGCFLNGCCWGAVCTEQLPWSVRFPHDSRIFVQQWEDRQITVPAEFIRLDSKTLKPELVPFKGFDLSESEYNEARDTYSQKRQDWSAIFKEGDLKDQFEAQQKELKRLQAIIQPRESLMRQAKRFNLTMDELHALATHGQHTRSHTVHPVQLYASVNGLCGAMLLSALFYRCKRHGVVSGLFFIIYPTYRIIEEIIRADNPHDTLGLTISTFTSLVLYGIGIAWLITVYRLPLRSPRAGNYPLRRRLAANDQ